jgi:hypothetical protein
LRTAQSTFLAIAAILLMHFASLQKMAATELPLSWSDVTAFENHSIIFRYVASETILLIIVLTGAAWFLIGRLPSSRVSALRRASYACFGLTVSGVLLSNHFESMFPRQSSALNEWLRSHDVYYAVWDWPRDVEQVGLPMHLVYTSIRTVPPPASPDERKAFGELRTTVPPAHAPVGTIVIILCEACWHDGNNFSAAFAPLRDMGFRHFRAVSPAYGGQTVNASFELLTGLPAHGVLTGVIYQEFADVLASQVAALPGSLRDMGYRTFALHNHFRKFWRRDEMKPRLGFDRFISREDMASGDATVPRENTFIDDGYLFAASLELLREQRGRNTFSFLTTVHTHGPYLKNADDGEADYENRLRLTLRQAADFSGKVLQADPDAFILLLGDHKPGMAEYFQHHDIPFQSDQATAGDVPAYLWSSDQNLADALIREMDGKPFYCLSQALGSALGASLPSHIYARNRKLCQRYAIDGYATTARKFESWLYYLSLFDTQAARYAP